MKPKTFRWLPAAFASSLLFAGTVAASAQETSAPAQEAVADLAGDLEPIRARHGVPALGGAIVRGRGLAAIGVAGVRKAGSDVRATPGDLWHLGSCTKSMTATLAGRLVDAGKVKWETTVGEVFPDLAERMDPAWKGVTLELLLQNRGGAPADLDADGLWLKLWSHPGSPREQRMALVEGALKRAPEAAPGTRFLYSNAGFSIAGAMLEKIEDLAWEDLVRREVFEPLGMKSAGFGAPGTKGALDQPLGHRLTKKKGHLPVELGPGDDNPSAIAPAGKVHCTLADWAAYAACHLRGARGEEPFLKTATFARLHALPPDGDYAMGWGRPERDWAEGRVLCHSGSNTMWFCVIWVAPEKDIAFLAVCNQGGDGATAACDEAVGALLRRSGLLPQ